DGTVQPAVARFVDPAHAARAEERADLVAAVEHLAELERRMRRVVGGDLLERRADPGAVFGGMRPRRALGGHCTVLSAARAAAKSRTGVEVRTCHRPSFSSSSSSV